MRAVDHCVEALCTNHCTPAVAKVAGEGLRHLVHGLLACSADQSDVDAHGMCQIGAWKAMESVHRNIPLGASHAIGHQLGGVAGVPHVETSCVMLHAVLKYNESVDGDRQKVADTLWDVAGETFDRLGISQMEADAGDLIKTLVKILQLPTTLGEVGVEEEA